MEDIRIHFNTICYDFCEKVKFFFFYIVTTPVVMHQVLSLNIPALSTFQEHVIPSPQI